MKLLLTDAQLRDLATWTAEEREELEERAAICEFDAVLSRAEAEHAAYTLIAERRRVRGCDAR